MKFYLYVVLMIAIATSIGVAFADRWHDEPVIVNNYITVEPTTTNASTDVYDSADIVDSHSVTNNYTADKCVGLAAAQASGSNQMYFGSDKPQLSLGLGECGGDLASSLMFGMKIKNNLMLNGSWLTDNDANAFGIGLNVIFK